jgi:uncharacterized repeat protein (TIGR03987 family)
VRVVRNPHSPKPATISILRRPGARTVVSKPQMTEGKADAGESSDMDDPGPDLLHVGRLQRPEGGLHRKHLLIFAAGLFFDFVGTRQMNLFAQVYGKAPEWHNLTGVASLGGMAFHFLLALIASVMGRTGTVNRVFHRVSLSIYTCWLAAFFSGAISGMLRMKH